MAYSRKKIERDIGLFMQRYTRKKGPNGYNDRHYDRQFENIVKRMDPEEFSRMMNGVNSEEEK